MRGMPTSHFLQDEEFKGEKLNALKFTSIHLLLFLPPLRVLSHTVGALCLWRRWRQHNAPFNAVWAGGVTGPRAQRVPQQPGRRCLSPQAKGHVPSSGHCTGHGDGSRQKTPCQPAGPLVPLLGCPSTPSAALRAGFPPRQRPWSTTCSHREDEDVMQTRKAWSPRAGFSQFC